MALLLFSSECHIYHTFPLRLRTSRVCGVFDSRVYVEFPYACMQFSLVIFVFLLSPVSLTTRPARRTEQGKVSSYPPMIKGGGTLQIELN